MASLRDTEFDQAPAPVGVQVDDEGNQAPVPVDPNSITTLRAGQGAEVTTRENASHAAGIAHKNAESRFRKRHSSDKLSSAAARASKRLTSDDASAADGPERTSKNIFMIVGAAILALVVLFLLVRCVTGALTSQNAAPEQNQQSEQPTEAQQQEASADGSVVLHGVKYALAQGEGGAWWVTADGEAAFSLSGTPTAIILCNGVLVVPENLASGWDLMAYMPAAGSLPTQVTDSDGNAVGGSGAVTSAALDGSTLVVNDSTGATTNVSL
ncbi:hypothetical protein [Paratractidigestivibacter sp.]|uniref:hypothetical protein n=1 Tax=Paratractidigestivibacter sp. TaxID=2847316 RepID=UPI002AC984D3|nr:hypothetical protein [Paratractidigestivibacter sp.]